MVGRPRAKKIKFDVEVVDVEDSSASTSPEPTPQVTEGSATSTAARSSSSAGRSSRSGSSASAGSSKRGKASSDANGKRPLREVLKSEQQEDEQAQGGGSSSAGANADDNDDERTQTQKSEASQPTTTRREAMRKVAESRAAHFARADQSDRVRIKPVRSSVNFFGSRKPLGSPPAEGKEYWPGPFATARQLIERREEAAAERQAQLAQQAVADEVEGLKQAKVEWQPRRVKRKVSAEVPTLASLSMKLLLQYVDAIESLGCVTTEVRYQFAVELARVGKLTSESLKVFVEPGLVELYLPDCKELEERHLMEALQQACSGVDEAEGLAIGGAAPSLRVLSLKWCGRCFGHKAAEAIISLGLGETLETLELCGLFRLKDESLISMLGRCKNLRSLELPYKSTFSLNALRAVVATGTINSLSLANCAQLDPEASAALVELKNMKRLDLRGLRVTDDIFEKIMENNGATLTSLSIRECPELTNQAMTSIDRHCRGMATLDLSELHGVTEEALTQFFASSACARALEEVYLNRSYATDDTIVALAVAAGRALRKLELNSVHEVTDVSIVALTKYCADSLRDVDLSFCRKVSDDALGMLADACASLRTLSLWGCTQVTDRFVKGHSNERLRVPGKERKPSELV